MSLRVAIAGQKRFGAAVLALVLERGHSAIVFPPDDPADLLCLAAGAARVPSVPMWAFPDQVDLLLAGWRQLHSDINDNYTSTWERSVLAC